MGWFDYATNIYSSVAIQSAAADAPDDTKSLRGAAVKGGASPSSSHSGTNEESDEEAEVNKKDQKTGGSNDPGHKPGSKGGPDVGLDKAGPHGGPAGKRSDDNMNGDGDDGEKEDEDGGDEDEDEEDEEDEPVDPMPKLQEQCEKTAQCAPLKHHYDECAERVTSQLEEHGKAQEDCVEEYFHLMHCATQCAAPKLFKQLR